MGQAGKPGKSWGTGWKAASAKALKWACAGHVWEQKEGQCVGHLLRGEC